MYLYCLFIFALPISLANNYLLDHISDISTSQCDIFKLDIANSTAIASHCFVKSSQPMRICQNCRSEFLDIKVKYEKLLNGSIMTAQGVNCAEVLLRSDIMSVMDDLFVSMQNEWVNVNCDHCYKEDGKLTVEFVDFLRQEDKTMGCMQQFTNASLNFSRPDFETIWTGCVFRKEACTNCSKLYDNLNKLYGSEEARMKIPNANPKYWQGVCGDMGDIMNTTRYLWSKQFKCDIHYPDMSLIVPVCVLVVVLFLFYCLVSTYFHNHVSMVFYKQRRLRLFRDEENPKEKKSFIYNLRVRSHVPPVRESTKAQN